MADLIDRQAVQEMVDRIGGMYPYRQIGNRDSYSQYNEAWTDAINRVDAELNSLPSAQPESCDSRENDKVFVDKDAYEQCRFEYINACKITHNRTPDTRQSDINDAYAVIKALQPIFGGESF